MRGPLVSAAFPFTALVEVKMAEVSCPSLGTSINENYNGQNAMRYLHSGV